MSVPRYDFEVVRGNTATLRARFLESSDPRVLMDLTGAVVIFTAVNGAWSLTLSSEDGDVVLEEVEEVLAGVAVPLSKAQTRALSPGKVTQYEIEVRLDGAQTTMLAGWLTATGGINDD